MANMSYCRFENTLSDLRDCYEAMDDTDDLSEYEERARWQLIKLCMDIAGDYRDQWEDYYEARRAKHAAAAKEAADA